MINRAAVRANITGTEALNEQILEATAIDIAAEKERKDAAARRRHREQTKKRRTRPKLAG